MCQLNFLLWKRNSRASVIKALAFPVFENNTCTVGIVDSCFPFYCMDLVVKSMACFLFLCVFSFFHCLVRPWMMKTNMVAFETGMWISFPSLLWLKVHDHQSLFNLMDDDFLSSDYSFYSGFLQYVFSLQAVFCYASLYFLSNSMFVISITLLLMDLRFKH